MPVVVYVDLCCPYLFLISLSSYAPGGLCFVIMAFSGTLNVYYTVQPSHSSHLWEQIELAVVGRLNI